MKLNVLALALGATALSAVAANAQTAVIEERHDPPLVVIERDHALVTIEKREHRPGSKTVTKSNCD